MTKRAVSKKYNESCIKVFELLSLLSKGTADFSEIINLFRDEDGNLTQKSNVILNKYMNTLKIFGVEVKKDKNKYYLMKMPFCINMDESGLYAVALMKSAMNYLPAGKARANLTQLIEDLQRRYDYSTQKLDVIINKLRNYDLSFYFKKFEKQIADCENYCQDGFKLEIFYYSEIDNQDCNIICVPLEVKYQKDNVCLSVYNPLLGQIIDIPMNNIKNIKQLEAKSTKSRICTTVIFKLKGDLAKRYKLRDNEYSKGFDENGWLIIVNSGEDFNTLATRLFKYDKDCVVLSPKYLREHLIKTIDKTLKNYL